MQYVLKLAVPRDAEAIVLIRLEWEVNGVEVASPLGELGSQLTANLELLLVDGESAKRTRP